MITGQGEALVFRVEYIIAATGLGATGVAPTASVKRPDGTDLTVGAATVELDAVNYPGIYQYTVPAGSNTQYGTWLATFTTADLTVETRQLSAQWYVESWVDDLANITVNVQAGVLGALSQNVVYRRIRQGQNLYTYRGDTWVQSFTNMGNISTRTKMWIAGKKDREHLDPASMYYIEETAGLEYLNGVAVPVAQAGNGSIVVSDAVRGNFVVTLVGVASAELPVWSLEYDIQWLDAAGTHTIRSGNHYIEADVVRATS